MLIGLDDSAENDGLWYKDAIIYELHVRAFHDSDGDGIGDFAGLTSKLDYLQDLGVTAIWLLPFYPSPLRDDGYDIADYTNIHASYGALEDFQTFLFEAHKRGLKVITELVINHTSDQHPWFQRARRAPPGSPERNFYVWNDSPERYKGTRIIFKDFETSNWSWDPVAKAYYWHRFYGHQPDLNFENLDVQKAVFDVMDMWFRMGVDGMRLDAVPYLYEREGTSCENLDETHVFLRKLRAHVDANHKGKMLLSEANQWPEDAIAYFGDGDECHMSFHFPLMPRLFMATRMEDSYPIIDILRHTPPIPDNCQWALFLRNHDELTLEMVTDEERDYMYRVYADDPQMRINLGIRRRLAPLLGNHRARIELMNGLLFSMPGTPVIYYGDEIGMGDNIYLADRNGVRTPMQWSGDRNAGFSRANPQRLYLPTIIDPEYHYEAINVEAQENNPQSMLWWMRRIIGLRNRHRAFSRGTIEFLHPDNRKVLAYVRRSEEQSILVVANLSRFPQAVELDLSEFKGRTPMELFGQSPFKSIDTTPYALTLGPYGFYWFALEEPTTEGLGDDITLAVISTEGDWNSLFTEAHRPALERLLPRYMRHRRWFGGKGRPIRAAHILDVVPLSHNGHPASLVLVHVEYVQGDPETYALPLSFLGGEAATQMIAHTQQAVVARAHVAGVDGALIDAAYDRVFMRELLLVLASTTGIGGVNGKLCATPTQAFIDAMREEPLAADPSISRGEQSNTSVLFGDQYIFKFYRRVEPGMNPEIEFGRFLANRYPNAPESASSLEYRRRGKASISLGLLQRFVPNQGNAWDYTIDALSSFFERALSQNAEAPPQQDSLLPLHKGELPELARDLIGPYLYQVKVLGQRTAELHIALASDSDDPAFAPEPFTDFYRRGLYHGLVGQTERSLRLLRQRRKEMSPDDAELASMVLASEDELLARFAPIRDRHIAATRIRTHGDYHLGQVLWTGRDFIIIDFEGEPARALSERRIKRSPLRDVAGMLRSFSYAAQAVVFGQVPGVVTRPEVVQSWVPFWQNWVSHTFLEAYLETADNAQFLPPSREELRIMLDAYIIDKATYELSYELNNRPAWVRLPLLGILQQLNPTARLSQAPAPQSLRMPLPSRGHRQAPSRCARLCERASLSRHRAKNVSHGQHQPEPPAAWILAQAGAPRRGAAHLRIRSAPAR